MHFLLLCLEKSVSHNTDVFQARQIIDGVSLLAGTINLGELPTNQYMPLLYCKHAGCSSLAIDILLLSGVSVLGIFKLFANNKDKELQYIAAFQLV